MEKIELKATLLDSERFRDYKFPNYPMKNGVLDKDAILDLLKTEEYGFVETDGLTFSVEEVQKVDNAVAGKATQIELNFTFKRKGKESKFPVNLFLPNRAKNAPLIVFINFFEDLPTNKYMLAEELIDNEVSIAHVCYKHVASDDGDFTNGLSNLIVDREKPSSAGKISVWAYAAIKVGEYLLEKGYAKKGNMYVAGHSRLGKTALWACAQSDIFSGVLSNCSGCGGAAVYRGKIGETLKLITMHIPYWFVPNFNKFSDNEQSLPFDQHFLLGLICPKKLVVVTAEDDVWADTDAQHLCVQLASNVYKFLGKVGLNNGGNLEYGEFDEGGNVCFSKRKGTHYLSREDWAFFIRNIKR